MIVLLSDPRLAEVPIRDSGETLVDVRASAPLRVAGPTYLRYGLVDRLVTAQSLLPRDVRLLIVDGYRPLTSACRHATCAVEETKLGRPDASTEDLNRLVGICATPPAVAPHPTGGAVDLTLSDEDSAVRNTVPLPACCTGPIPVPPEETWKLLTAALGAVGLVNYPARWWHWSYGDRFWAHATQTSHARYGPLPEPEW
jgi:D-alanyl-D-alanine dipeptidase